MTESAVIEPRPIAKHAAPRGPRRWPWIALGAAVVLLLGAGFGGLWYASGVIADGARASASDTGYPLAVTTVAGSNVAYTNPHDVGDALEDQGLMGVVSIFGGYSQTESPTPNAQSTSRRVTATVIGPPLAQNQPVTLDPWYFPRNPKIGLGLDYEDVTYDGPLGPTPAWFIPGTSPTWVIYVHGLGATPLEGLRIAQTANASGHPVLLIRYRDDAQAPSDDGYAMFGADEWPDLEGAVQFALDRSAENVVIAGSGMGGSIALAFVANSALSSHVAGLFLDSPITQARAVVEKRAADRGVPAWATSAAAAVASWRFGFDWDATDYTADAAATTTPTLVVQGTADERVPPASVDRFASAADPTHVTVHMVDGAPHGMAWNVDRTGYERLLSEFLDRVA